MGLIHYLQRGRQLMSETIEQYKGTVFKKLLSREQLLNFAGNPYTHRYKRGTLSDCANTALYYMHRWETVKNMFEMENGRMQKPL